MTGWPSAATAALLLLAGCAWHGRGPYAPAYLPGSAHHGAADRGGRFEPRPGVACDAGSQVCFDRRGPDVGLTREYFGTSASRRLADDLDRGRKDPVYRPKERVRCDRGDEVCYRKGVPDYRNTRQQFGRKAASGVREPGWGENEIRPKRSISCDTVGRACFKSNGEPAVGATRKAFGKKAAREQKRADD